MKKEVIEKVTRKAARAIRRGVSDLSQCMRIEVKDARITASATNYAFSIDAWESVEGEEPFVCIVNAKTFLDLINRMNSEDITFSFSQKLKNNLEVSGGRAKVNIPCLDPQLWAEHKALNASAAYHFVLNPDDIAGCMHSLKAPDTGNELMSSVYLEIGEKGHRATALDGYRISVRDSLKGSTVDHRLILNGEMIQEIIRLSGNEEITIETDEDRIQARTENMCFYSSVNKQKYFNTDAFLSENTFPITVECSRQELLDAINVASLIQEYVDLKTEEDSIVLSNKSTIGARSTMQVTSMVTGKDLDIRFNSRFMIESLKSISDDTITIGFFSAMRPFYIIGDGYKEVVLPVAKRS